MLLLLVLSPPLTPSDQCDDPCTRPFVGTGAAKLKELSKRTTFIRVHAQLNESMRAFEVKQSHGYVRLDASGGATPGAVLPADATTPVPGSGPEAAFSSGGAAASGAGGSASSSS